MCGDGVVPSRATPSSPRHRLPRLVNFISPRATHRRLIGGHAVKSAPAEPPRRELAPAATTLAERERAKVSELTAPGRKRCSGCGPATGTRKIVDSTVLDVPVLLDDRKSVRPELTAGRRSRPTNKKERRARSRPGLRSSLEAN